MKDFANISGPEVWGEYIVPLLYCSDNDVIVQALIGCDFEQPLEPRITITDCHPLGRWVIGLDGHDELHCFALSEGIVYVTSELETILRARFYWQRSEIALDARLQRNTLEQFGLADNLHDHDLDFLHEAIVETQRGHLPRRPVREKVLALVHCPYRPKAIVSFAQSWIGAAAPDILPGELAALAQALRHLGRSQEAADCTQVMEQSCSYELPPIQQGILLTIRASALLDLVEERRCTQIFAEAVECIERAKAHFLHLHPCPQFQDVWKVRKRIMKVREML